MERKNSNRFIHSALLIPKPDCRYCIITHCISSELMRNNVTSIVTYSVYLSKKCLVY